MKFRKAFKEEIDKPLEAYISQEDLADLAESMGIEVIEEPSKEHSRWGTDTYALPWRDIVRVPLREEEDGSTRTFVLLHELGHVRMGHGYGRETAEGAVLEELEATNWALTQKAGIPKENWIVDQLAAIAQDVGLTEFGLTEKEAWKAARRAAEKFGIHKSLIWKAEKVYWKQVGV